MRRSSQSCLSHSAAAPILRLKPFAFGRNAAHLKGSPTGANPRLVTSSFWSLKATAEDATPSDEIFVERQPEEVEEEVEEDDTQVESEGFGQRDRRPEEEEGGEQERLVQLSRVATTLKGGRKISFRAVMVVGDGRGTVGVGNAAAAEVVAACRKATIQEAKFGAAKVMLRPAAEGTGLIAGGAVQTVLEVAGVRNAFGKILNSSNPMNVAKATVKALSMMRTVQEVAEARGVSLDYLLGRSVDPKDSADPEYAE